jgi:DNA-binding transcriptional MerR regulator
MGNSFVYKERAAELAGVCERSLFRYARKGLIKTRREGRRTLFSEEDLLRLKKGRRDVLLAPMRRDTITKLISEVQALQMQVSTITRILNIKYDSLDMTLPEYERFYQSAEQYSFEGWPPHVEEMWADYFVRIKVEDLEKIEKLTGDPHPWRPFLKLVSTMHLKSWNKDLMEQLAAGKNNLHQIAGIWAALKEESPRTFDMIAERDSSPNKTIVKRMTKAIESK